jgi:hypothetical protein
MLAELANSRGVLDVAQEDRPQDQWDTQTAEEVERQGGGYA